MILSCKDIKMEFGVTTVLENVTFLLNEGEKAALIGVNGAGKTTLLKILAGEYQPTDGELIFKKGISIGYLAQMKDLDPDKSVEQELLGVFDALIEAEFELRQMERDMADHPDLPELFAKYDRLSHYFESNGGFEFRSKVRGVIAGLGFGSDEGNMKTGLLSGGQKTRVSLGKLLLSSPDLLLLDEPTNHLDIGSITWLEDQFLAGYKGSVVIVSHDRYFIDKTSTKIIEIENKSAVVYNGSYTYYADRKEKDRETQLKHYIEQQREIRRQEDMIRMYRSRATEKMIIRAKSKEKLLAKVDRLAKPQALPDKMRVVLEPKIQSGNDVLFAEGVGKRFEDFRLFRNAGFDIKRGETVALIGANGIGKTTLFKILLGKLPMNGGYIRKGTNVNIAYYDQEHAVLDETKTCFDEVSDAYPRLTDLEVRNVLAAFVFYGDDVFKPISLLSGGEKGRIALAKIMLSSGNLLMLDEPTNHLDMYSKEILEDALRSYTGTVFYISHDRYFINNTADKVLELTRDGIKTYLGNYDYYVEKKREEAASAQPEKPEESAAKTDWAQKKQRQSDERKQRARIAFLEKEIAGHERQIAECDEKLASPEIFSDHVLSREVYENKVALEQNLEELYAEWEGISE